MTDEFASTIGTEAAHAEVAQAVAATTKLSHQFAVVSDTTMPSTVMTDDCYGRIQTRIKEELGRQSVSSLWIGAFFAFLSVCASAYLARIVLPENLTSLPAGTRTILWVIVAATGVISAVCGLAYLSTHNRIGGIAKDICSEMDTYSYKAKAQEEHPDQ
jgi:hypothetical protein